jgi:hypothetical protein
MTDLTEASLEEICKAASMIKGPVAVTPTKFYRYIYDVRRRDCWLQILACFKSQWRNKAFWQYMWQDSTRVKVANAPDSE